MSWVSSSEQARRLDQALIQTIGVPGIALMELASRSVATVIRDKYAQQANHGVLILCGGGNNGGDGYGVARWLMGFGFPVSVWSLSKTQSTNDANTMRNACRRLGITEVDALGDCGLIVDAVFGTGLSRPVQSPLADLFARINQHPAPVVAVDLPSGLNADNGQVLGSSIQANDTITFGRLKPAFFTVSGAAQSGEIHLGDIGVESADPGGVLAVGERFHAHQLALRWPSRSKAAYKQQSGHLLVVAGSLAMAGAAVLTCQGALRSGVGLISLVCAPGTVSRLGALPPEVMVSVHGDGDRLSEPPEGLNLTRYSAIAVGPGLGGGRALDGALLSWLTHLWSSIAIPMVFDADALVAVGGKMGGPRVITPHIGEASRILGRPSATLRTDRFDTARQLCAYTDVALLKGPFTLVSQKDQPIAINETGNAVLATAGSGDVLTGVIGGLLARAVNARDAAILGAHVHGAAADQLCGHTAEGWTASHIAAQIAPPLDVLP